MKKIREILMIVILVLIPILGIIGIAWSIIKEIAILKFLFGG